MREKNINVKRQKVGLVVCDDDEHDYHKDRFYLLAAFTVADLIMGLAVQNDCTEKQFDVGSVLPNGYLQRLVYNELPKYM